MLLVSVDVVRVFIPRWSMKRSGGLTVTVTVTMEISVVVSITSVLSVLTQLHLFISPQAIGGLSPLYPLYTQPAGCVCVCVCVCVCMCVMWCGVVWWW